MPPTSAPKRGFTLIELLVALAIAGLLTLTAAAMLPRGRVDLDRMADELARDLRQTRQRALSSGHDATARLSVKGITMPGAGSLDLPDGVTLGLASGSGRLPAELVFRAGGGATGATLVLAHGERREHVVVGWLTGAVRHE